MGSELFDIAVTFAILAGTIASVLSVLAWHVFQQTPARRVLATLSVLVVIGTVYHVLLLLGPDDGLRAIGLGSVGLEAVKTLMYTAVAALVVVTIVFNRSARGNLE